MNIELKDISKTFWQNGIERTVLKNSSLKLQQGKIIALTGVSGAGKSTLLSIAAGIQKPSSGSVFWNGTDIAEFSDDEISKLRNKNIGFVSQEYSLIPSLNVLDNVRLPFFLTDGSKSDARQTIFRARELLVQLGLEKLSESFPGTLSGGENRRTVIARALMNDPEIIIADEPSSNLDSEQADKINLIFRTLAKNGKQFFLPLTTKKQLLSAMNIMFLKMENCGKKIL